MELALIVEGDNSPDNWCNKSVLKFESGDSTLTTNIILKRILIYKEYLYLYKYIIYINYRIDYYFYTQLYVRFFMSYAASIASMIPNVEQS